MTPLNRIIAVNQTMSLLRIFIEFLLESI